MKQRRPREVGIVSAPSRPRRTTSTQADLARRDPRSSTTTRRVDAFLVQLPLPAADRLRGRAARDRPRQGRRRPAPGEPRPARAGRARAGAVHARRHRGAARASTRSRSRASTSCILGRGLTLGRPLALLLVAEATDAPTRRSPSCTPASPTRPRTPAGRHRRRRRGRAGDPHARQVTPGRGGRGRRRSRWTAASCSPTSTSAARRSPGWITPRLGGVGPTTIAMLFRTPSRPRSGERPERRRRVPGAERARPEPSGERTRSGPSVTSAAAAPHRRRLPAVRAARRAECAARRAASTLAGVGGRPPAFSRAAFWWTRSRRSSPSTSITLAIVAPPARRRRRRAARLTERPAVDDLRPREEVRDAREDHAGRRRAARPRRADHPLHRGRRHRRRHLARRAARARRRGGEARQDDRVERGARRARRRSTRPATGCPRRPSQAFRDHLIGIKGPLTTPIGGGIRSLNVALRQILDLYVCLRPVRWFTGVPSPVKHPEKVDMVIFRENTEDIYAGLEVEEGTPEAKQAHRAAARTTFGWDIRPDSGIGIKPISETGSKRLDPRRDRVRGRASSRKSVTLVHKGNIRSSPRARSATGATSSSATSSPTSPSAGTTATASPATRSS